MICTHGGLILVKEAREAPCQQTPGAALSPVLFGQYPISSRSARIIGLFWEMIKPYCSSDILGLESPPSFENGNSNSGTGEIRLNSLRHVRTVHAAAVEDSKDDRIERSLE